MEAACNTRFALARLLPHLASLIALRQGHPTTAGAIFHVEPFNATGSGCRSKVRMPSLCKVEMSAFLRGWGPMEEERIELSAREWERLKALHEVEKAHLRQRDAAHRLRLSTMPIGAAAYRRGSRAGA